MIASDLNVISFPLASGNAAMLGRLPLFYFFRQPHFQFNRNHRWVSLSLCIWLHCKLDQCFYCIRYETTNFRSTFNSKATALAHAHSRVHTLIDCHVRISFVAQHRKRQSYFPLIFIMSWTYMLEAEVLLKHLSLLDLGIVIATHRCARLGEGNSAFLAVRNLWTKMH